MLKLAITFFVGGVLGSAVGFGAAIFAYPYIFPPPPAADAPVAGDAKRVATGAFIHADPGDPLHHGKGKVTVYQRTVRLEADFKVGPGPKFHVYLVPKAPIRQSSDLTGTMSVDLGRLRAFEGAQNYKIPKGVDLSKYKSVVIWCEAFGVLISPATLVFK